MLEPSNNEELPVIPGKRYFTIALSDLCGQTACIALLGARISSFKARYRGNRRYYQRQT